MTLSLHIEDLALSRGGRRLFSGLELRLESGQACALTGANGSGKTSLLRAVAGLCAIDSGHIAFGAAEPAAARSTGLHLLGHLDGLKVSRTAGEELVFWTGWQGGTASAMEAAVRRLDLQRLLDLEVRRLSAGQRRRLALARLLSSPRPLWLLDEPLSPLDAQWRAKALEIMAGHLTGGGLILAAVHDPLPLATLALEILP
ncbi:heme ABC exporter ATP-binding protein CcmA [Phenylobacterium sp.]|uniref:heme ABC exporter ATP-binding protein CcmA n=2 Tax=Phenylobacterium sp. TaxID=1871053 RepID=UPI0025E3ABCD|nr:heme ABC exporter ATP-binding protein CcmA [Phenylobacterium sp.]MCA3714181.1 heme ABC exporter ATP-binding protein CcmA [Phenylobacterium sp.]MCA3741637.1 heme ABC exporter ATP-binding protein CcmA [Phenylobacterium sp.]